MKKRIKKITAVVFALTVILGSTNIMANSQVAKGAEEDSDNNSSFESDWVIDFGPEGSPQWETYTMMYNTTLYEDDSETQSYGFTEAIDAMETETGGNKIRDFVFKAGGEKYTFKIDLPNGTYSVFVYSGNKESDSTINFYFNDESDKVHTQATPEGVGSDNYGGENTYETYVNTGTMSITFWGDKSLGEDAVTGALNSLEIVKVSDNYPKSKEKTETKAEDNKASNADTKSDSETLPWVDIIVVTVLGCLACAVLVVSDRKKK